MTTDSTQSSKTETLINHEFKAFAHLILKERIKVGSFRIKVREKNWGNQGEQKEGKKPELPNHKDQIPKRRLKEVLWFARDSQNSN